MDGSEIQIKAQLNWHTKTFKLPLSGVGDYETLKIIIRSVFNLDDNTLFLIEYSHSNEFYFISSQENLWEAIDRTLGKELSLYITEYDEISPDVPNNNTANADEQNINENVSMEQNVNENVSMEQVNNEESIPVIVKPSEEIKPEVKVKDEDIPIVIKPSENLKSEVKDTEQPQSSIEYSKGKEPEVEVNEQAQTSVKSSEVKKPEVIPTVVETKVESKPEVISNNSYYKENKENIASTSKGKEAEITEDLSSVSETIPTQKTTVNQSSQTENSPFNNNMSIRDIVRQSINLQTDAYRKIVENIKNQTREDADIVQNITNIIANEYPNEINQLKQNVKNNIERHNEECKKVVESLRNQTRNNADVVQNIVNTISNECRNQYPEDIRQFKENVRRTTNIINQDVQEAVNKITNVIDQYSTYKNIFLGDILDQLDRRNQNNSTSSNNTTSGVNSTQNSGNHQPLNQNDETLENVKGFINNVASEIKLGVDSFLSFIDEKEEKINNIMNGNESGSTNNTSINNNNSQNPSNNVNINNTNNDETVTNEANNTKPEVHSSVNVNEANNATPEVQSSVNEANNATPEVQSSVNEATTNQDLPVSSNETTNNVASKNQTQQNNVAAEVTSNPTTETETPPNVIHINGNNSVPQDPIRNIFNNIASEIRIGVNNFLDYIDKKDEMITNFILGPYNEFDMMVSNNNDNNNNNNTSGNNKNTNTNETKINEVATEAKPENATTTEPVNNTTSNAVVSEIIEATEGDAKPTTTVTEEESSSDKYEKPIIQGRNDTEHSNHYFIEQFNKYKEEYSRKKLEEKKAQEVEQVTETKVPDTVENPETPETSKMAETAEIIKIVETQPKQSEQSDNNKEVKEEKPTPLSPSRTLFNTMKNTLLDGITNFATSSRFVDDGFLGVPIERDPTTEITESTENTTTTNDTHDDEEPVIQMKQVTLSEYEKTENTNEPEKEETNDVSVATRDVEEFSNGIINYNDLEEVEKQHAGIAKNSVKTSANKIADEEMSVPISEDSYDYHSYSPVRPEGNSNLNVSEDDKNERTDDELDSLNVEMSSKGDDVDENKVPINLGNIDELYRYMKKGKREFEEEYIHIDSDDNEESTYDNKAQGRPISSSKKAQQIKVYGDGIHNKSKSEELEREREE